MKYAAMALMALLVTAPAGADEPALLYKTKAFPGSNGALQTPSLVDGHFGRLAELQKALQAKLTELRGAKAPQLKADGVFGKDTRTAIVELLKEPQFRDLDANGAHDPVVTDALWRRLLPNAALPSVHERAMAIVMTYEATDFDAPAQWNFCQSVKSTAEIAALPTAAERSAQMAIRRRSADVRCDSNDPKSFLTWGPRGATAGGGREVQAVLLAAESRNPGAIAASFGARASEVARFTQLAPASGGAGEDVERYLCAVWLDQARASEWAQGFAKFGSDPNVRAIFNELYTTDRFDGGKMKAFYKLYAKLGRQPTEIDYAFFLDRATHTSGVFANQSANSDAAIATVAQRVMQKLPDARTADAWKVRRAIADVEVPSTEPKDRNARDVTFFVSGATVEGLTEAERTNWRKRGMYDITSVGLADTRDAPALTPSSTVFANGVATPVPLTAAERAACPIRVLNWVNPSTGATRTPPKTE